MHKAPHPALDGLPIPLLSWYSQNARALPWREEPEPYHVWVSEIMLQQTRVAAVIDYYRRFLEALPTVEALAGCPREELMKLWQGLGYYSRAGNLQKAAQVICRDYGGRFPSDYASIRSLPGVGDYTAGAVASIAFGLPVPAVDGNVLRVVARLTGDRSDITRPDTKRAFTAELEQVIPTQAPGDFNQAMMELGATVCLPNGQPLCESCPAKELCTARREDKTGVLPVKAPKKPRKIENRTVYLLFREGKTALRRRPEKGLLAGLWEFPHVLEGETLPIPLEDVRPVGTGRHIFTHIEWHMTAYAARTAEKLPEGWVWASGEELEKKYPIPSAFRDFLPEVERLLRIEKVE